jgi:hypothetical protein
MTDVNRIIIYFIAADNGKMKMLLIIRTTITMLIITIMIMAA